MTISFVLLTFVSQLPMAAAAFRNDQSSAVLWKDQLFVAVGERLGQAAGCVYRGTFSPHHTRIRSPAEYWNPTSVWRTYQTKLDLRDNRILLRGWGGYLIFPMADLPLFESNAFGEALWKVRGYPNFGYYYNWVVNGDPELLLFPPHRKPDVPVPPIPIDRWVRLRTPEDVREWRMRRYPAIARFDVQLAASKSVRLFHAYKDQLFISIEPDYLRGWYRDAETGDPIKNPPAPPDRQLRMGKLPAEFTEMFTAHTAGGRDYLVTNTGKAYIVAPKGKTEVEVTALWNDPKQIIAGVVQDQANDAVYGWGFAGEEGSADRFYVKLEPKPVAKPYKLTVPLWNERADAYLESYECARAFRNAMDKK